jgi:hypothetical protein
VWVRLRPTSLLVRRQIPLCNLLGGVTWRGLVSPLNRRRRRKDWDAQQRPVPLNLLTAPLIPLVNQDVWDSDHLTTLDYPTRQGVVLIAPMRVGALVLQCLRLTAKRAANMKHVPVDQPQQAVLGSRELASRASDQVKHRLKISLSTRQHAQDVNDSVMLVAQLSELVAQITRSRGHQATLPGARLSFAEQANIPSNRFIVEAPQRTHSSTCSGPVMITNRPGLASSCRDLDRRRSGAPYVPSLVGWATPFSAACANRSGASGGGDWNTNLKAERYSVHYRIESAVDGSGTTVSVCRNGASITSLRVRAPTA